MNWTFSKTNYKVDKEERRGDPNWYILAISDQCSLILQNLDFWQVNPLPCKQIKVRDLSLTFSPLNHISTKYKCQSFQFQTAGIFPQPVPPPPPPLFFSSSFLFHNNFNFHSFKISMNRIWNSDQVISSYLYIRIDHVQIRDFRILYNFNLSCVCN